MCPKCSYSLREQRLREGQVGPQINCRKCKQLISAKTNVCPHCGIDFPKRTFNLVFAALPVAAILIVFAVIKMVPARESEPDLAAAPPPLTQEPPEITPPQTEVGVGDSAAPTAADSFARTEPIVVETPSPQPQSRDTGVRSTTRWTADWVNVRRDPTPGAPIEQQLNPGVRVEVGRFESGFWEVFLDGRRLGYVANSLLLREPPEG